ncbi:MAG: hypothetical protein HC830_08250 [Bacteroidetes bacterium]|nr:hypothetical protein [Bacteroidota bacterium]
MGVDIREEDKMFDIAGTMKEGSIDNLLKNPDGLLIGIGVARKLNIRMNDNLTVTTASGVLRVMKVVGIFETTIASVDKSKAYSNISTAQKLQKQGADYITDIKINLKDKEKSSCFCPQVQQPDGLYSRGLEIGQPAGYCGVYHPQLHSQFCGVYHFAGGGVRHLQYPQYDHL